MKTVYIVIRVWGEYADHHEVIIKTFNNKKDAEKFIEKQNDKEEYIIEESEIE